MTIEKGEELQPVGEPINVEDEGSETILNGGFATMPLLPITHNPQNNQISLFQVQRARSPFKIALILGLPISTLVFCVTLIATQFMGFTDKEAMNTAAGTALFSGVVVAFLGYLGERCFGSRQPEEPSASLPLQP